MARETQNQPGEARWWDRSVGYQIYLRSFADSDGDGVGDFAGLTQRLDHLAWLGVDMVWVTPFYPSPMADFGYDISDYVDVDPLFGTLADADAMIERAHELGLRVVFDIVPNHSSDQHQWFVEARRSRDDPKRDWFIWRDPAPDGGPPNNWVTHFGGPAWTFDELTGQYYLHLFLPEQPDLNWANPAIGDAWDEIIQFWLDRGVDGFRIDVTQGMAKDADLRSNPELRPLHDGMDRHEQWESFEHRYDIVQPESLDIFRRWNRLVEPAGAFLIGETYVLDAAALHHFLTPRDGIHAGFWFQPMHIEWSPDQVLATLRDPVDAVGGGIGWCMSSHDDPRAPGRFGGGELGVLRALGLFTMFCGLPGTPFLYMGDELGLVDGVVPLDRRADPVSFRTGVEADGRDGCRTPMTWEPGPGFGFSTMEDPWLPFGGRTDADTVAVQATDPMSPLSRWRRLLSARRRVIDAPGFAEAAVQWRERRGPIISFRRGDFVFALNAGDAAAPFNPGAPCTPWFKSTEVFERGADGVDRPLKEPGAIDPPIVLAAGEAIIVHSP